MDLCSIRWNARNKIGCEELQSAVGSDRASECNENGIRSRGLYSISRLKIMGMILQKSSITMWSHNIRETHHALDDIPLSAGGTRSVFSTRTSLDGGEQMAADWERKKTARM